MELDEFLAKKQEIDNRKEEITKELTLLHDKAVALYDEARQNKIYFEPTEQKWYKDPNKPNFHVYSGTVFCNFCGTEAVKTLFGSEYGYWCNYNGCKNNETCPKSKLNFDN